MPPSISGIVFGLHKLGAEQPALLGQPRLLPGAPLLEQGEEPIDCRQQRRGRAR